MRRRTFITLLGGAVATWPSCVYAERTTKLARIGFLATGALNSAEQQVILSSFQQGLRERGYVEGVNIVVEYRGANGKIERFPELATELVRLSLDLIVASNTPAARAAKEATTTVPIVVPVMGDPVGDGLVASLARPGGNITGMTFLGPELATKRLELLKQALPTISRVAALWHPHAYGESTMREMMRKVETAAGALMVQLQLVEVRGGLPSSIAHSWRWRESAPMLSSCCLAQCFSASEDISSILPRGTACPRSQWRGSSRILAACWHMERASLTCSAAPFFTWT